MPIAGRWLNDLGHICTVEYSTSAQAEREGGSGGRREGGRKEHHRSCLIGIERCLQGINFKSNFIVCTVKDIKD